MNGAQNLEATFTEMKGFIFEYQTAAEQAFAPQSVRGYLEALKVTNDIDVCQAVTQYIIIARAKYLQMMVAYFLFTKDYDRGMKQFTMFNEQYEKMFDTFKKVFGSEFKPEVPP